MSNYCSSQINYIHQKKTSSNMGCFSNFLFNQLHHSYLSFHTLLFKCVCPLEALSQFLVRFVSNLWYQLFNFLFLASVNPIWFHLSYFLAVSFIGFMALKVTDTRSSASSRPGNINLFFTSVSASTVSSMTVVEMEVFSTSQLLIMTVLMFFGGEVFMAMISLQFRIKRKSSLDKLGEVNSSLTPHFGNTNQIEQIELGNIDNAQVPKSYGYDNMKLRAMKSLSRVILGYLIVVPSLGSSLVSLYTSLTPSARDTLKAKGLNLQTFSIFLCVSTFANCGYVPTNENMIAFRKNPGLLLILLPQILMGNTLFPCCLRLIIWVLTKKQNREEYAYMLRNYKNLRCPHLFSTFNTCMLAATALGFTLSQFVLFCVMEWWSEGLEGLNSYEKLIGSLFEVVNTRHSGESIVDLSTVSTAIIVLFVVMMYLPPYTIFIPTWKNQDKGLIMEENKEDQSMTKKFQRKSKVLDCMSLIFSPLSTLFIFTFLICITERKSLRNDPLNFNVLNIIVEVVSSYGNVGFSMGYSCKRRLNLDETCNDMWYGFAGRWSKQGKALLIIVMLYGRLKKFNLQGGRGWHMYDY